MTALGLPRDAWGLLDHLVVPATRSLVFAGAMGLALSALRVSRAAVRLCAWTIVLYAALAMPLLGWVLPGLRWSLPNIVGAHQVSLIAAPTPGTTVAPATNARTMGGAEVALSIYLAGLLVLLLRGGLGWMMARRLYRVANPVKDTDVLERLRLCLRACGSKRLPRLAEAETLSVPLTLSVVRPVILLPANWRQWGAAKLDAVLSHELAHVARGDAFTQRLSLLHRAVFWFSPLSWWLHHHLEELAEQASDEAALDAGADRTSYAETLLGFFAQIRAEIPSGPRRVRWQALGIARNTGAEQRIERILAWKDGVSLRLTRSVVLSMVLFAAPVVLLTASVRPSLDAKPQAHQIVRMETWRPEAAWLKGLRPNRAKRRRVALGGHRHSHRRRWQAAAS